ncbi:MAG: hypothetical protein HY537_00850 [Deltaproteobacteria bacterium]|nr:hypothetical protein [Deltaproteobacteria bacterium]
MNKRLLIAFIFFSFSAFGSLHPSIYEGKESHFREEFFQKVKKSIREWDSVVARLRKNMMNATKKLTLSSDADFFSQKLTAIRSDLDRLKLANSEKWLSLVKRIEARLAAMKSVLERLSKDFDSE